MTLSPDDNIVLSFFLSFVLPQSALRQVHSLFPSEFSTQCDLQFPFLTVIEQLLRLLPRLPVTSVFPTLPYFRRQFLRQMWPIQLASSSLLYVGYFFPPCFCVILTLFSHVWSNRSCPPLSSTFQTFQVLLMYLSRCPYFSTMHVFALSKYRFSCNFRELTLSWQTVFLTTFLTVYWTEAISSTQKL